MHSADYMLDGEKQKCPGGNESAQKLLVNCSEDSVFQFFFPVNVFPIVKEVEIGHIFFINGQGAFDLTKDVYSFESKFYLVKLAITFQIETRRL